MKKITWFLFFFPFVLFSQQKRKMLYGTIKTDSLQIIKNANVINLVTQKGTFSNDDGAFKIPVTLGDSLRISSVQYKTKIIYIGKKTLTTTPLLIKLQTKIITLDEVIVKNINLTGVLEIDKSKVPTNVKDSLLRKAMTFTKSELTDPMPEDYVSKNKPPIVNTSPITDAGFGAGSVVYIPFKDSERLWALRRKLAKKEAFPEKILSELGEKFFFNELKIPREKYYHFLSYCNLLGIEEMYENKETLKLIKTLKEQSKSYLKIISVR